MRASTKVKVTVNKRAKQISLETANKIAARLNVAALNMQAETRLSLSKKGGGRIYQRGNITHQASVAGKPPATDTGRLRDSILVMDYASPQKLKSKVGTNLKYAPFLEYGTVNIAARPFWRPAIDSTVNKLMKQLKAIDI